MRISSTVLLKDQHCLQSHRWNYFRPLGNLQTIVDEIESYGCDEIAIIRPVRSDDTERSLRNDIDKVRLLRSMTPITFGGGIRDVKVIDYLKGLPVERIVFSSAFLEMNDDLISYVLRYFGRQSLQCFLPLISDGNCYRVFNSGKGSFQPLSEKLKAYISRHANEIIIHDCHNEGLDNHFHWGLIDSLGIDTGRLIVSGGVGAATLDTAKKIGVASVLIDNKTLHKEYSIAGYRHAASM